MATEPRHRLFWLGAGASRPAGGLLNVELRNAVVAQLRLHLSHGRRSHAIFRKNIFEQGLAALGAAPMTGNFEDALSACLDPFWGDHVLMKQKIAYPRDAVRGLSFATALAVKDSISLTASSELFRRFFTEVVNPGDTVVSLNYDLLAEHYLGAATRRIRNVAPSGQAPMGFVDQKPGGVVVAHLHGAYNNYVCDRCGSIHNASEYTDPVDVEGCLDLLSVHQYQCDDAYDPRRGPCGGNLSPAIVPPFAQKTSFSTAVIGDWDLIYKTAGAFSEVLVVGWSLPTVDMEARNLLQWVLKSSSPERLTVVGQTGSAFPRFAQIFEPSRTRFVTGGLQALLS